MQQDSSAHVDWYGGELASGRSTGRAMGEMAHWPMVCYASFTANGLHERFFLVYITSTMRFDVGGGTYPLPACSVF